MKCRISFINCDKGSAKHLGVAEGRGGRKPADDVCIDNSVVIAGSPTREASIEEHFPLKTKAFLSLCLLILHVL